MKNYVLFISLILLAAHIHAKASTDEDKTSFSPLTVGCAEALIGDDIYLMVYRDGEKLFELELLPEEKGLGCYNKKGSITSSILPYTVCACHERIFNLGYDIDCVEVAADSVKWIIEDKKIAEYSEEGKQKCLEEVKKIENQAKEETVPITVLEPIAVVPHSSVKNKSGR